MLAVGRVVRRDQLRRLGDREQGVDPAVGRAARVRLAPVRAHAQRAGGLAPDDDRVLAVGRPAGRPRSTGRRRSPRSAPRGRTARCATPRRRRAAAPPRANASVRVASARRTPSASTTPPFMSTVPEPVRRSPSTASAPVGSVRDDGVDVADEQEPALPLPSSRSTRSGACSGDEHGNALGTRLLGRQRRGDRRASSAAATSPDGVDTPTSARELALRARGDAPGPLVNPRVHATSLSCHEWHRHRRQGSRLHPRRDRGALHPGRAPRRDRRAALLSRRRDARLHQAVLLLPRPRSRTSARWTPSSGSRRRTSKPRTFTAHHGLTVPPAGRRRQDGGAATACCARCSGRSARRSSIDEAGRIACKQAPRARASTTCATRWRAGGRQAAATQATTAERGELAQDGSSRRSSARRERVADRALLEALDESRQEALDHQPRARRPRGSPRERR